jgi:hypothetical protein
MTDRNCPARRERGAPAPRQRTQQSERNAVLSAERHEVIDAGGLLLDGLEARGNIAQRNMKIADVRQHHLRHGDPRRWMSTVDQHPARQANGLRSEARSASVGRADIERDACNRYRRIALAAAGPKEPRRNRKGRIIARHGVEAPSGVLRHQHQRVAAAYQPSADGIIQARLTAARLDASAGNRPRGLAAGARGGSAFARPRDSAQARRRGAPRSCVVQLSLVSPSTGSSHRHEGKKGAKGRLRSSALSFTSKASYVEQVRLHALRSAHDN